MIILGIETSCDDSCIALAKGSAKKFELISNLISSQVKIHQKWGGVYPLVARREHQKNLTPLLAKALKETNLTQDVKLASKFNCQKLKKILEREAVLYKELKRFLATNQKPKIDLIAVTMGPGLDPCLWTGVNFARALACCWKIPIMGINHIEGHILANWLKSDSKKTKNKAQEPKEIKFPAISLIVSGGHTQIILMKSFGKYKILGETRDDAAGEAFDKIARILGLPYPGGPAIAKEAAKPLANNNLSIKLPRPMLYSKDYDFSFSGLKTAVLYDYKNHASFHSAEPCLPVKLGDKKKTKKEKESKQYIQAMAREAQQAIIDVLIKKTIKATKDYKAKSILLGGGVTANKELQKQFKEKIKKENLNIIFHFSDSKFCTDNAAMIAFTAWMKFMKNQSPDNWQKIKAQPNLRIDNK